MVMVDGWMERISLPFSHLCRLRLPSFPLSRASRRFMLSFLIFSLPAPASLTLFLGLGRASISSVRSRGMERVTPGPVPRAEGEIVRLERADVVVHDSMLMGWIGRVA